MDSIVYLYIFGGCIVSISAAGLYYYRNYQTNENEEDFNDSVV